MNRSSFTCGKGTCWAWFGLGARLVLGGYFLYSGIAKALEPSEFLKLLRAYDLTTEPLLMNVVAAGLPWFEIFCGLLLVLGVGIQGTALVTLLLLIPFTAVVWNRALDIQEATGLAFCTIRFDCGCGTGDVAICQKLLENGLLMVLGAGLLFGVPSRWALGRSLPTRLGNGARSGNHFRSLQTYDPSLSHDNQALRSNPLGPPRQRQDHGSQRG
jgi:putative oxidoreductase